MSTVGKIYAVTIGAGATVVPQIMGADINPNIVNQTSTGSGLTSRQLLAKVGQDLVATFSTQALATAHGICALNGYLAISAAAPLAIYSGIRAAGAELQATGTKYLFTEGILVCTGVSGSYRGLPAIANYSFFSSSAAGTVPWTVTAAQALPTSSAVEEWFTVGPVVLNNVAYSDIQTFDLQNGFDVRAVSGTGLIYPRLVSINRGAPVFAVSLQDQDVALDAGVALVSSTIGSSTVLYLRKVTNTASLTGGATDISFTVAKGKIDVTGVVLDPDNESELGVTVTPANTTITTLMTVAVNATSP